MNKKLLITALFLPLLAFSQSDKATKFGPVDKSNPVLAKYPQAAADKTSPDSFSLNGKSNPRSSAKREITAYNFVKVGSTTYDLQTNASIGRRIVLHDDGKVSLVWTTSDDLAYTNRGTGYNHFDNSNWLTVANPTKRLENVRLGWPSIGTHNGKEWVMGHDANNGGFVMSKNASIGSQTWNVGSAILTQNGRRPIWGRVANNGDTFHCMASYADSTALGDPRAPRINGVYAPYTYSRSVDGGSTWDIQHMMLPGYDSSRFLNGGGDNYAIDVKGSTVAIAAGGLLEDVTVWISHDNGDNFTKMIADSFEYAPYTSKTLMDFTYMCDGSIDVLIDNDNKVHAFWGVGAVQDTDTADDQYSFYPATQLLAYWNEVADSVQYIAGNLQFDRNGDDTIILSPGCWNSKDANGQVPPALKSQFNVYSVARITNTSVLHMPSAGIDGNGNIFVSFSFPVEYDLDPNNVNLRDIFMVSSTDGGATWSTPQDVTQMLGTEEEFACVAKKVDGFVHMVFQTDDLAGNTLSNNTSDNNHPPSDQNFIMYAAIPVSKLLDGSLGQVGLDRINAAKEVFVVSQNYPNPFSNNSEVLVWLNAESNVSIEISNISGQLVSSQSFGSKDSGNHVLNINAEGLSAGIYFYTVKTDTHSVTKKMTIN